MNTTAITNQLSIIKNTKRILSQGDDGYPYTVYAAIQDEQVDCLLIWMEYNADPIYLGWYDLAHNNEKDSDFDSYDLDFDWSDCCSWAETIADEITAYNQLEGDLYVVTCHNHETGEELYEVNIKTIQQAYPLRDNGETIEYVANAIAENGLTCLLSWDVPTYIHEGDLSDHNWSDVNGVDFR